MKQTEQWRPIPGTDGLYDASILGEIRSWNAGKWGRKKKPNLMYPFRDTHGCACIKIKRNGKYKQIRLLNIMVDTWYGKRPEGMSAYHKNFQWDDNRLCNIGFATTNELRKTIAAMTMKSRVVVKMNERYEVVAFYKTSAEAGRKNFMHAQTIRDHCNGRTKNELALDGFRYRYADDLNLEREVAL